MVNITSCVLENVSLPVSDGYILEELVIQNHENNDS